MLTLTKLGTIVGTGLDFPEARNGFGRHQYYLSDHQVQEFKKYTYGEWIQTFFTLMFTKVSVCLLLLRISPGVCIVRPIQGLVIFLVMSNTILSLLWILQCIPIDGAWDFAKRQNANCFSNKQLSSIIMSQASECSALRFLFHITLISHPFSHIHSFGFHPGRLPHHHSSSGPDHSSPEDLAMLLDGPRLAVSTHSIFPGGLADLAGTFRRTAVCCIVRTVINWQNNHADQTCKNVALQAVYKPH